MPRVSSGTGAALLSVNWLMPDVAGLYVMHCLVSVLRLVSMQVQLPAIKEISAALMRPFFYNFGDRHFFRPIRTLRAAGRPERILKQGNHCFMPDAACCEC